MQTSSRIDWSDVRRQFRYNPAYIHLADSQFLSSHPEPVREAIQRYRDALDADPAQYTIRHEKPLGRKAREAIADYFDVGNPDDIALTDSATMGLGILYTGLHLRPEDEIVIVRYDHYSHQESIRLAANRAGACVREVGVHHDRPHEITREAIVREALEEINDRTRVLGLTWVHSSNGLKVPVADIAEAIRDVNRSRREDNRLLLVVDGVHGFGIERETFKQLGCDFFVTSLHKWMYGPRGTGFIAASSDAWQHVSPVIPCYTSIMDDITSGKERPERMSGKQMTPGGFHSLEHRWAIPEAVAFMRGLGKEEVYSRVHALALRLKKGLASLPHVTLHTPMADELSSGIVAFEADGYSTNELVAKLLEHKVVATASPYQRSYARLTPGIVNTEEEVDRAVEIVSRLRK